MLTAARRIVSGSLRPLRDLKCLARGASEFRTTGTTPAPAYQALISLYCRTRGLSSDLLHWIVSRRHPAQPISHIDGVLGHLSPADVTTIADEIGRNGFYIFPQRLPEELCIRLEKLALTMPARPFPQREGVPSEAVYDRRHPLAETYKFSEQTLVDDPDFQMLAADTSLLAVAQAYLGSQPVLEKLAMWWSTSYSQDASLEAAQLYHFDMDRIKWIKFFIYLADVTAENGPHCFIKKTHRRFKQPSDLLRHGYARHSDEAIAGHYQAEDIAEITGRRGTIVAEDTRGLHKGKALRSGDRLMAQVEFCDSLFGTEFQRPHLKQSHSPALLASAAQRPHVFCKFIVDDAVPELSCKN